MYQIIQYDLRGKSRDYLVKQVMSLRIAQYLIKIWNHSAERSDAPVQYFVNVV